MIFLLLLLIPWNLDRIDQRVGLDGQYNYSSTGRNVTVYVLDSGIDITNPEFEGRAENGYGRYNSRCDGHGTGVAAVVGGKTYGVAKEVRLVSVKFRCTGFGTVPDLEKALDWIYRDMRRHPGPTVVNFSNIVIGGTINTRVQKLIDAGTVFVAGAGNNGDNACNYSPGNLPDVITVGATRSDDTTPPWTNYGSCVDLYAPGEGIATVWPDTNFTEIPEGKAVVVPLTVTYASGTSFSAPHVSGLAAMYLEANSQDVQTSIVNSATRDVILGADPNLFIYTL